MVVICESWPALQPVSAAATASPQMAGKACAVKRFTTSLLMGERGRAQMVDYAQ
jgi:hypothetical protein